MLSPSKASSITAGKALILSTQI